jgi:hypothetical protein
VLFPVADSAVVESRDRADGWEAETDGGPSFCGYLVELAALSESNLAERTRDDQG